MRILFYGDSNTWGYNALDQSRFDNRFTARIQKELVEHTIIENGLCGRTLCHEDPYSLDIRNGMRTIRTTLKCQEPLDLVVIMLGTNDAKRVYGTNALTSIEKGLDLFLHEALDYDNFSRTGSVPKFLVLSCPLIPENYREYERFMANFGHEGYQILNGMSCSLKAACDKHNVDFLELNVYAGQVDALHLDEKGHEIMAQKLIKKLGEYR